MVGLNFGGAFTVGLVWAGGVVDCWFTWRFEFRVGLV